jgi:hypothetical protein
VVLVALCFTMVLGIAVAGYVALCARTMVMSNRSFCYTSSTQLAETGLEEALWTLNKARSTPGYTWPGWTIANGTATKEPLTGFATNKGVPGVVNVRVEDFGSASPTITAHGISQMPDGIAIDKELKIKVRPAALFSSAVGAYQSMSYTINWTDTLDSYDSSLGDYSEQTPTDQAIVCAPNVSVNAANILGYVATTRSAPVYTTPGTVRGLNTPAGVNRDPSRISTNASQNLFDVLPDQNLPGLFGGTLSSSYLNPSQLTRYLVYGDLTLGWGTTLTIDGPVIIVVSGNLSIQDTGSIVITPHGSAQIIVSGSIDLRGQGIVNQSKLPKNLGIFRRGSAGSCSSYFNIDGSAYSARLQTSVPFYGVIYDPYGSLVVYGPSAVYGSLVANVVAVGYGNGAIHYDLDLRHATFSALNTSYDIAQWLVN